MNFAIDDAEFESARAIIARCIVIVLNAVDAHGNDDSDHARDAAGLSSVLDLLRSERTAIRNGDRATIQRVRLLYGALLKEGGPPPP